MDVPDSDLEVARWLGTHEIGGSSCQGHSFPITLRLALCQGCTGSSWKHSSHLIIIIQEGSLGSAEMVTAGPWAADGTDKLPCQPYAVHVELLMAQDTYVP